jgi:carboxypeptidase family protein/TonB-dependent receptor-like protein
MIIHSRCGSARFGVVVVALLIFLCSPQVKSQTSRSASALEGTVRDSSGAVIPGAKIVINNTSTDQIRTVITDEQGSFHSAELPVALYEIIVQRAGFADYQNMAVMLVLGETFRLNIVLAPASSMGQVTVKAEMSAVDPSQTSVVFSIDQERIEELPVRSRNYLDFVLLAPGVSSSLPTSRVGGAIQPLSSGFSFGGLRARSNNISVDGLDNNDEFAGSSRIELSPEIVQEFQVVNNGISAESGGASGGSINVITRSGTNAIHGDAFIFAQDSAFNARDPFETDPGKPNFRRFREGFALGGPVIKNRTFYYVAAEQEHNRGQNGTDINAQVSSTINQFLATGAFPRLSARKITAGFFPISRAETEIAGKVNHQLTNSTSLMLRYTFTNNKEASDAFNTAGLADVSSRGSSFTSDNSLSGSVTTVYGSETVGDLRFQAATRHAVLRTNDTSGPEIDIAGLASFGRPYGGNSERRENHYQGSYTYTRTRGKQLWKVGGAISSVGLRASVGDGFGGVYLFGTLADFLAGRPDQFRQAFGGTTVNCPVTNFGSFVQDHWSLTSRVTLDLGLRYDFEHLPARFNEKTRNFNPRIGLAWGPLSKLVFRAGYGVFFDRYALASLARTLEKNGTQAFEQVADGAAAASLFFESEGGPLLSPALGIAPSIYTADPRLSTPYTQQASAGMEYQLALNLTLRADYLFVHGVHLSRTTNVNLLSPVVLTAANSSSLGISNATAQQLGRPVFLTDRLNPQFNDIYELQDSAGSNYKGISFTLNRRMNEELEFSASYTLSKAFDDASDFDEQPEDPFSLRPEWSLSLQHQQQRFVFNALWELPIGDEEDKPTNTKDNSGWLTKTFSHIEVAPIFSIESGRPVNPLTGLDSNLSHAFPLSSRPLGFNRNSIETPGQANMDFRLLKYFPFGKSSHLDLVAESFNLLNHPNVSEINSIFGTSLSAIPGFGQPIDGTGARRIQFSLDFEF